LGVEYPNLYASDVKAKEDKKAHEFNCHQRGAMNPHESYATVLFGLAFGGLSYPYVAAGAGKFDRSTLCSRWLVMSGAAFGVGSLLFYFGYASGSPDSRYKRGGFIIRLGTLVLQILPFVTA
jgi:hypothetical protein